MPLVSIATPPLDAVYGAMLCRARADIAEAMLITLPPDPRSAIAVVTGWET